MAQIFQQALGGQQSPYEIAMAELMKQQQPAAPMFTPEQVQQRIRQNDEQMQLGLLGQMSQDRNINNVGGSVLKQVLAARAPQTTQRGEYDPLTGSTAVSPEYADSQHEARRGKVLDAALRFEDQRTRAQERAAAAADAQRARADLAQQGIELRRDLAAVAKGSAASTGGLKNELTQARIDSLKQLMEGRDAKAAESARKIGLMSNRARERAEFLVGQLDTAEKMVSGKTAGLLGSQLAKVPGTDAYNLNRMIDTVKANIGFDELRQMRLESPTGGALGQVAVKELDMLQASLSSLDTAQDPETLKSSMKQVRAHFKKIAESLQGVPAEVSPSRPPTDMPPGDQRPGPVAPGGAPAAPAAPAAAAAPGERTATNPQTGQKVVFRNGQWVPL